MGRSRISSLGRGLAAGCLLGYGLLLSGCSDPVAGRPAPGPTVKVELPKTEEDLRQRIDKVLRFTQRRYLNTRDHAAWQIMHGILAYPHTLKIYHDGELVPALKWLLQGGRMRGFTCIPRGEGRLDTLLEGGSKTGQGHDDQWLAILAQAGLKWDDPIVYRDQKYKVGDLVTAAKHGVFEGAECSWTLIGLTAYPEHVSFDEKWIVTPDDVNGRTEKPEEWSIERIVRMEATQDLTQSACGGSHRLIGLTMALERYREYRRNNPVKEEPKKKQGPDGWQMAQERIDYAIRTMRQYQQPDGAFSARYLERASTSIDIDRRINTTGHTLEFLSLALPAQRLQEEWIVKPAVHLCELFEQTSERPVECGSLYHAGHALLIYYERRWGKWGE